ncbi:hypothetical protein [Streptomyces sp. NPDC007369]|uniref:hypothetical protein n=1 Tax=Streptomyces sp. NPDC007369 TaxID=3154589 RepID=UPI0034118ED8
MAAEDLTPSYYMVEDDDSIDTDIAERINQFNWDPDGAGAVMALFPVDWTGAEGELVTLRENGTVALDLDGAFELPEPYDRGTPPTMITTTTGMAVLKPNHPDNQTIESGFRAVGIPVPDVVRAMNAREAARTGDRAALRAFVSEGWDGGADGMSRSPPLCSATGQTRSTAKASSPPARWTSSWPRPRSSTGSSSRSGSARPTGSTCDCSTPRLATG